MRIGSNKQGRVALVAGWAVMAPVWAGQSFTVEPASESAGEPVAGPIEGPAPSVPPAEAQLRVSPALMYGPIKSATGATDTRVTVVASHDLRDASRSVHALIEKPGELVRWVSLPIEGIPEAAIVVAEDRFVCLSAPTLTGQTLTAFNLDGHLLADETLKDVLPDGAERTRDPVSLISTLEGACLTVHLQCGTVALVEVDLPAPETDDAPLGASFAAEEDPSFRVCSLVLSDKHACGVDAWLTQARQLDRAGDTEAAKYALEAAIETDPTDARGYRELAQFHRRRGEHGAQVDCLEAGVTRLHAGLQGIADDNWQVGSPAARLTVDYVTALQSSDDAQRASDALGRALELYPCMEQIVLLQAELLIDEGQVEAATDSLHLALGQLDPNADLAAAYHDVGRFLMRQRQPRPALRFLEDAFALGDESEFLLRGLADASLELNEPSRAADWLSRLASRWRSSKNGASGETRAERAEQRLNELDEEITRLIGIASEPGH